MPYKLLLADDSVTIQRVIALTFAEEDVEVVTVGDGQQAIDRMDVDPPDIVLADIDMPKRDGYEVAAYIKSRPRLAHIPVVLLTGAFEPVDEARAAASGSSDVLTKPFEPQMVINRVRQLLGRKRPDSPATLETPPTFPVQPARSEASRVPQAPAGGPSVAAKSAGPPVSLDDYFDQLDAAFANIQGDRPGAQAAAGTAPAKTGDPLEDEFDWITQPPPSAAPTRGSRVEPTTIPALATGPKAPAGSAQASASLDVAQDRGRASRDVAQESRVDPPQPAAQQQARPVPPAPAPAPPRVIAPPPLSAKASAAFAEAMGSLDEAEKRSLASVEAAQQSGSATTLPPVPRAPIAVAPVAHPAAPPARPAAAPAPSPFAALSAAAKTEVAAAIAPAVITDEIIEDVCTRVLSRLSDRVVRETVTGLVSEIAERLVREEIERIKAGGQ